METNNSNTNTVVVKPADEKSDKYEIYTVVLIGIATVIGALSAYYSALWGGDSQTNYTLAIQKQSLANTAYLEALSDYTQLEMDEFKDDILYAEWKNNVERGDPDAEYYFAQLSEGFQKDLKKDTGTVSDWEQQQTARLTELESRFDEVGAANDSANLILQKGQEANQHGDKFTFATVLLTIVLFFGGLAALKTKKDMKKLYLGIATLVFVLALIRIFTAPFPG